MTNEIKARQLANYFAGETDTESAAYAYSAAMVMAQWKDEQFEKEKQQLIDKAMKVICDGCAQKAECEFYNWKTCSKKDELIKSIEQ